MPPPPISVKPSFTAVGNCPAIPHDTRAAIDFLNHWQPEGSWLLSAIEPDGGIETKTFNNAELAADWIESRQGKRNLYFSVNQTNRRMNKKAKKADIVAAAGLHVDIDPADDEDQFSAKPKLIGKLHGFRERPTVIIDS